MSDLISRAAAIDEIHKGIYELFDVCDDDEESPITYKDEVMLEVNKAITERIRKLPSAQPEIIACGDCKHWICHDRRCGFWNHGVKPLDWCCHAERRTDD